MPLDPSKIFMFPEEWIELRKELVTHWPDLWKHPGVGWAMAFDADLFVETMNSKLDGVYNVLLATDDRQRQIGYICGIFLKELRRRRGEANP